MADFKCGATIFRAVITVFVNGEATVAERANANKIWRYGRYRHSNCINGILTIGSDDNQTITNTNLSSYDYSVSSSDADIILMLIQVVILP